MCKRHTFLSFLLAIFTASALAQVPIYTRPQTDITSGTTPVTSSIVTANQFTLDVANKDVNLFRDAAGTLAQRNGVNAQCARTYNTFTDASNGEWGILCWSAGVLNLGTEKNGTGATRGINLRIGSSTAWAIDTSGNWVAQGNQSMTAGGTQAGFSGGRFNATVGSAPTIGACGTSPSVTGRDSGMFITVGTGGAATACTANFSATWTNAPRCFAQNDTDIVAYKMVTTATTLTITAAAAFTASSHFHVICIGQ